jgi:hypothetical protein
MLQMNHRNRQVRHSLTCHIASEANKGGVIFWADLKRAGERLGQ